MTQTQAVTPLRQRMLDDMRLRNMAANTRRTYVRAVAGFSAFAEILRALDSPQLTAKHQVATPADWQQGGDVIIVPAVSDEVAKTRFPEGWKAPKPYLRIVPQPGRLIQLALIESEQAAGARSTFGCQERVAGFRLLRPL